MPRSDREQAELEHSDLIMRRVNKFLKKLLSLVV